MESRFDMPVLFLVLWIIFNGRVTLEIFLFGLAVSTVVYLFVIKVMGHDPENDIRFLYNIPIFFLYILNLIAEIVKASFSVMTLALSGRAETDPVIVEFDSEFPDELRNVLLANSITLTPGTITVRQDGSHFVIHALRREYAEGIEECSFVRLLRKVR